MKTNNQVKGITLEIDTKKYQELVDKELDKKARMTIDERLSLLFLNPVTNQTQHEHLKNRTNNNPDISAGYTYIKDLIDKRLLGDEFQAYVERYIEHNWSRILDTSLEVALTHKAHAIAFKAAKGKLIINDESKDTLKHKL